MGYFPEYARLLNEALIRLDRSPAWLAQRLGISPSTVSRWLNQGVRPHDPETVVRVADVLGLYPSRGELLAAAGYGYQELRTSPEPPPAEPSVIPSAPPAHNLSAQLSPFFGREAELAQIAAHLADPACRLLTLVGPGGVGKTRLALEAAARQVNRFADGVFVVFLAAVLNGELLAGEILQTLGAPVAGAGTPDQQLRSFLRDKEMLLVLDNFEQLADSAAVLAELLAAAPRLKILVTARQRLYLSVEWLIPLEGLAVPAAPEPPISEALLAPEALEALTTYSAIELFTHAARRVQPGFALTSASGPLVARICRLLDGFPLAMELAAGWVRLLPVSEILADLERSAALLATTLGDVPQRHHSMDAVFDHSWSLLTPRDQSLLRQLSVFRGGFTRAGTHEVTGASITDLAALADKSWLRTSASGRYDMHELVRQYCEQRLDKEHDGAVGETPAEVRGRHCRFIGTVMSAMRQRLNRSANAVDEILPEMGNLQAAWRYATETLDAAALDILFGTWFLGDCLGWFDYVRQTFEVGAVTLEERIRQNPHDPAVVQRSAPLLAWIRTAQRDMNAYLGRVEEARTCLNKLSQSLELIEPGDKQLFWEALHTVKSAFQADDEGDFEMQRQLANKARGLFNDERCEDQFYGAEAGLAFWQADSDQLSAWAEFHLGNYAEAERWLVSSISLSDSIGAGRIKGSRLGLFAEWALVVGDLERAERFADEGTRLVTNYGDRVGMAFLHIVAGTIATAAGRETEANKHLEQGLGVFRQCGQLAYYLGALNSLGRLALSQGDIVEARQRFEVAVAVFKRSGTAICISLPGALLGLGWTALAEGNPDEARIMFRQALSAKGCAAWETMDAIAGLARVLEREESYEQAVELLALVAEHRFTAYALRQQAIQWLHDLKPSLLPDIYAARVAAGRARNLAPTLAELLSQP